MIGQVIERDDDVAKKQADAGMFHTGYWCATIQKLLLFLNEKTSPKSTKYDSHNGSWHFEFMDPVTGLKYVGRIKPAKENNRGKTTV